MNKDKNLKLTTRGRYAVMAMVELAQKNENNPVPLVEIAEAGNISLSYLEQLFAGLRRNGLVKSYRGPGGGYVLAKPANDIKIADILHSAEDCVPARRVTKDSDPESYGNMQTFHLWGHIGELIYAFTHKISLEDVINKNLSDHPARMKLIENLT